LDEDANRLTKVYKLFLKPNHQMSWQSG